MLENYSPEKLAGALGVEFASVIDGIAFQQLLKQYEEAEASYQKALVLLLENKSYDANAIRKIRAGIYYQLGRVAQEQREFHQAREYFLKALEIFVESKDTYSGGVVLSSLACLWRVNGNARLPAAVASILGALVEETEALLRERLEDK